MNQRRFEEFLPAFEAHRAEPGLSLAGLLRRRKAELASEVLSRRRIYLDTKFWIFLRDAHLGRPQSPVHRDLLGALRQEVGAGRCICPLNESSIFELHRQRDPDLRSATVVVMDELSQGVVIQNTFDRIRTEVWDFLVSTILNQAVPPAPMAEVWLKVGHFVGSPEATTGILAPAEELILQKVFLDVTWSMSLSEMLEGIVDFPDWRHSDAELAAELTATSSEHESEMRSFVSVYEAELAGFWDANEHIVRGVLAGLADALFHGKAPTAAELDDGIRLFKNALRNVVRFDKAKASLPTSQVMSGLHAIVRWNKTRGFAPSDFYDFHHAAAAVPYCDVFFTERFLATMLTRPPLSFDERFDTVVVHRDVDALSAVRRPDAF
ncbi:MAG: hypothetical protein JW990_11445 [Thermoleophilia bacterium]|nr:hypothetical protein [Thermoleophilia bacterium]